LIKPMTVDKRYTIFMRSKERFCNRHLPALHRSPLRETWRATMICLRDCDLDRETCLRVERSCKEAWLKRADPSMARF
jgi:hypothetical protein